jgi:hypothetical protein
VSTGSAGDSGDAAREVGHRQSLFREVNERIEELTQSFALEDAIPVLCECGLTTCNERIELSRSEYDRLRGVPTHFVVLPGHDLPGVERVIEQNERFAIVEKVGESAAVAIELDPRRRQR